MPHVLVERALTPPKDREGVYRMALETGSCFDLYGVNWHHSLLSEQGARLTCHFDSVDMEAIRQALSRTAKEAYAIRAVTVHDSPDHANLDPNVAVLRQWAAPVDLQDIQAIEDAGAWCLDTYHVKFVRTYFAADRKQMVCLYNAPDAESVRQAQRQISMPMAAVWAFELIKPSDLKNTTVT